MKGRMMIDDNLSSAPIVSLCLTTISRAEMIRRIDNQKRPVLKNALCLKIMIRLSKGVTGCFAHTHNTICGTIDTNHKICSSNHVFFGSLKMSCGQVN